MTQNTTSGWHLNGADYNQLRGVSMTETFPPEGSKWHHYKASIGGGNDSTISPITEETIKDLRDMRLNWLDQFDLEISEEAEKGFRVWRWLGDELDDSSLQIGYTSRSGRRREVRWTEKRPWSAALPKTPGFWPSEG